MNMGFLIIKNTYHISAFELISSVVIFRRIAFWPWPYIWPFFNTGFNLFSLFGIEWFHCFTSPITINPKNPSSPRFDLCSGFCSGSRYKPSFLFFTLNTQTYPQTGHSGPIFFIWTLDPSPTIFPRGLVRAFFLAIFFIGTGCWPVGSLVLRGFIFILNIFMVFMLNIKWLY